MPELEPCAGCGLLLEKGTDPNGRAWHDCDRVQALAIPVTLEGLEAALMRRMHELVQTATARDAVALHREIQALKRPVQPEETKGDKPKKGEKASGRLLNWVAGPSK